MTSKAPPGAKGAINLMGLIGNFGVSAAIKFELISKLQLMRISAIESFLDLNM